MGRFHVAVFGMRSENSTYSPFTTTFADFRPMMEEAELREHYLPVITASAGQRLDLAETQPPLERGFDDVAAALKRRCETGSRPTTPEPAS